jgi:glutamine synthetase
MNEASSAADVEAFRARLAGSETGYVRCHFIDYLGIGRGREVSSDYLLEHLDRGVALAPVNYTWDISDVDYDRRYGPEAGDVFMVPDLDSFVPLPYLPGNGHAFCGLVTVEGDPWPGCTRLALKRIEAIARKELGLVSMGFEQEGFLMRKGPDGYLPSSDFKHHSSDFFDAHPAFMADLLDVLDKLGTPVGKFNLEDGHGQVELNTKAATPLVASEQYFRMRQAFRFVARSHGFVGTFMPKTFADISGSGLHVHLSIRDNAGAPTFGDPGTQDGQVLTETARHFIGGLLRHAEALVAIGCPTVNSYKRLRPGLFAPTHSAYGVGNRSAMVRVIRTAEGTGADPAQRIEVRTADGTCNPHLLAAALLAAGLDGVRRRIEPSAPQGTDVGSVPDEALAAAGIRRLPANLGEALVALEKDAEIREALGGEILDGFLRVKRLEWAQYNAHVSDWEYSRYAEYF